MIAIRRPSARTIDAFLEAQAAAALSYAPIGISHAGCDGFDHDVLRACIGRGGDTFARARDALRTWRAFPRGWIEVFPSAAPLAQGTTVAVLARHLGLWSLNACRVVEIFAANTAASYGFAYGTLADHVESGEERFVVELEAADESVWYEIRATSRPQAALARLGYPVARLLQARFRRDSAAAMREAVAR